MSDFIYGFLVGMFVFAGICMFLAHYLRWHTPEQCDKFRRSNQ